MNNRQEVRGRDADGATGARKRHARAAGLVLAAGIAMLLLAGTHAAQAQQAPQVSSFSVLLDFGGDLGQNPLGGLTADSAGNLYGTAENGGAYGFGTVYELPATGGAVTLYSFREKSDGANPIASLIRDASGNLYGTALAGGTHSSTCLPSGCGVVFKVNSQGRETVLYSFAGGPDGSQPDALLMHGGILYGAAAQGGNFTGPCAGQGCGVVFKVTKPGQQTILYTFTGGADGNGPGPGLLADAAGNLYGVTGGGGAYGFGTVFKVDPLGNETVLYSFTGGSDGQLPDASLTQDANGNLYGVTAFGGNFACPIGCGVVFKVDPTGTETVLYSFAGGTDGSSPGGGVIRDAQGSLYGTTTSGGDLSACSGGGCGTIFKLSAAGTKTVLHDFDDTDGSSPGGNLLLDHGYLYGTTFSGGFGGPLGVVYKLIP